MLSRLMTRKEQLVLLSFAGAILVGAAALWYRQSGAEEGNPPASIVAAAATLPPAPAPDPQKQSRAALEPVPAPDSLPSTPPPLAAPPPLQRPREPELPRAPEMIGVSAAGEVIRPDVYMLPEGARVRDLLEKAGGATDRADLSDINLAARLMDGSTLTIPARRRPGVRTVPAVYVNPPHYTISGWQPSRGAASPPPAPSPNPPPGVAVTPSLSAEATAPSGLIDLNTATRESLETLPGIGPKLAAEIVAYRERNPFVSVDDLTNVSGIGPKKLEGVRDLVTVR